MAPSWNGTEEKGRGAELEVAKIIQSSPLGKSPNGLHTFLYLMSSLSSVSPRELLFFFFTVGNCSRISGPRPTACQPLSR